MDGAHCSHGSATLTVATIDVVGSRVYTDRVRVTLTPRESAVLAAVERRLTNPEIAAELFLSVRTVESHIASLRRKLGAVSRHGLMDAAHGRRTTSVHTPLNPLRGRETDLTAIGAMLGDFGWVTVAGPGGVGKTRLALDFARAQQRPPVVVELEHADPDDVVARIARVIDLEVSPGAHPLTNVSFALSAQPFLLVLDNIDRVGPAVQSALAAIRASAPNIQVLTTSRTPVGDPGEAVYALSPVSTDGPNSPALAILTDRLRSAGVPNDGAEVVHAQAICTRLDGLPLALELAASVARHLSLSELASRLERDLATLDRASPTGRHRTLATTFEWTWDLLDDDERDALCRLAALPRTFDMELAVAVTHEGAEGIALRLLDHSLIVAIAGQPRRFRLLAVLREFVHAHTDAAVIREVHRRHAEFIAGVVVEFTSRARVDDSPEAIRMSAVLCPEVNAALRWALAAGDPTVLPLAASLAIGVEQYGSDVDSVRTLAMAAIDDVFLKRASPRELCLVGNAIAAVDVAMVRVLAERALALADDDPSRLAAHHLAGIAGAYGADRVLATVHLDEAERLALALGESWQLASVRHMRGIALGTVFAAPHAALSALESAIRDYARTGDNAHVHNARYMMALFATEAGIERDHAVEWAQDCVEYAVATGNAHEQAHAQLVQSMLGVADSEPPEALEAKFRMFGDLRCVGRALMLQARQLNPAARTPLLERAVAIAETASDPPRLTAALECLAAARWAVGDRVGTLAALDRLGAFDTDAAARACPPELRVALAG
jgi:predicted ATPase/DNA-binding CsgD family transcriptional regulator